MPTSQGAKVVEPRKVLMNKAKAKKKSIDEQMNKSNKTKKGINKRKNKNKKIKRDANKLKNKNKKLKEGMMNKGTRAKNKKRHQ